MEFASSSMSHGAFAALELGGTKTVAAIGRADGSVIEEIRFPTTGPERTLATATAWWKERFGSDEPDAIGVGSFGPIRVAHPASDFGVMLATPKPGWQGFAVAAFLKSAFPNAAFAMDTDVNAAALAESKLGAARGHADVAYITVGTGLGAGVLSGGRLVHGAVHPEVGHLRVPRHPDDTFEGVCPFHGDCLEGMCSGPAIHRRWGIEAKDLPPEHPAWEMEAWYLAHGIIALAAVVCPSIVVLGGGVPQAEGLHERVAARVAELSNGYFEGVDKPGYIVPPALGQQAGIVGALLLPMQA
ncbi:MAG: ROK family protein [Verrucomicrobiales bacterium]